jgi:hypothetical protein
MILYLYLNWKLLKDFIRKNNETERGFWNFMLVRTQMSTRTSRFFISEIKNYVNQRRLGITSVNNVMFVSK